MMFEELVLHIKNQLTANGIRYAVQDGEIRFMNAGDKARGEEIMFECLRHLLDEKATICN